jgi:hypothetical protein
MVTASFREILSLKDPDSECAVIYRLAFLHGFGLSAANLHIDNVVALHVQHTILAPTVERCIAVCFHPAPI